MQQKLQMITIFLVTALVFFGIGYVINSGETTDFPEQPKTCPDKTFQDGWDAAKKRLNETKHCFVRQGKFTEVEGEVLNVNSDSIKVNIEPLTPLADPGFDNRSLQITENTQFYRRVEIPEEEFQQKWEKFEKQREQFEKRMESEETGNITPPEPPERYEKEETELANVTEGSRIRATANKDIEKIKKFEVTEIIVTNENLRE